MSGTALPATAHLRLDATRAASTPARGAPVAVEGLASRRSGTVAFRGIEKVYTAGSGPVRALADIDLDIPAGRIFGIIGRSGAGKSSLLRLINRLETPTGGRVLVDDRDIAELDEDALVGLRRRIGMIFQHFNLLSAKTVWDNVALPLVVANVPRAVIAARVAEVLALVGLEDKHHVHPSRLSGGQKQRVGIARALVHHPEILLCDEATSALDPETTVSILRLLADINRRFGLTIVLITHEMSVIREICDDVLVLEQGRIVETGPVWRVFGDPRAAATRALLQPSRRTLPDDVARVLTPEPHPDAGQAVVLDLHFTGEGGSAPDIAALAEIVGGPVRLLDAAVDRIAGHTQGRLVVTVPLPPGETIAAATLAALGRFARHVEVLGHVPGND